MKISLNIYIYIYIYRCVWGVRFKVQYSRFNNERELQESIKYHSSRLASGFNGSRQQFFARCRNLILTVIRIEIRKSLHTKRFASQIAPSSDAPISLKSRPPLPRRSLGTTFRSISGTLEIQKKTTHAANGCFALCRYTRHNLVGYNLQ